ncbi:CBM35 domain-containing protein [Streptomyces sp. NPDC051642]|uniref:carbohydrate-binding protein n=1 Tax=unclassified Streptomyces TaxID=2593676 RepID=UPI00341EF15E
MSTWRRKLSAAAAFLLGLAGLTLVVSTPAHAACTTYYVSPSGSDSNDGCSTSTPWQSLSKVNATTFATGNQILFQRKGSWTGRLHPLGSGSSSSPVVISSYGSGAVPIIAGAGATAAIYLVDQHDWTIQNLEITNDTATADLRSGIQLQNNTSGVLHGIHIVNNNIHNVKGYWTGGVQPSTSGGIAFNLSDSYTTNGWDDVLIRGNTLTTTDAGGIYLGSLAGTGHDLDTTNVVVENNVMNDVGGNDVVCIYCTAPVVQHNVATNSGSRYSGAGFWMALNTGGQWQYNEVASQHKHGSDGQAFDIDHDNDGVAVQYNWTHDNAWGFFEFCCNKSFGAHNPVVRYNISQNDGSARAVFRLFGVTSTGTARIYNNTVYVDSTHNSQITVENPAQSNLELRNNIIYNLGSGGYVNTNESWDYNTFYGSHPDSEPTDAHKLTTDPKFVHAGAGALGRSTATAYYLVTGSPALGSGTVVAGNGGKDFFGNSVSSSAAPNRGAYNGAGVEAGSANPYEAESSANTLTGSAKVVTCAECSGGSRVGFVGNGNTLTFNGVTAPSAGSYKLTIAYEDGDAGRSLNLSVNGGTATAVAFPGTGDGDWPFVQTLTVSVTLKAGSNTIALANASAYGPDIDKITL